MRDVTFKLPAEKGFLTLSSKKGEIKDVQPIRSLAKLEDMKWSLRRHCSERDYILFLIGINTGLRVSDLLALKVSDVKGKKKLTIREGKTKKKRVIHLHGIYEDVNAYINGLEGAVWLFPSRKGNNPISRIQAYRQLNKAAEMVDMPDGIGTHTMRKTFGYWYYKQQKDIASLQMILNHARPSETLRYIGITDEQIEDSLQHFVL